jgi:hypothetical protein
MTQYRKKPVVIEAIPAEDAIQFAGKDWKRLPAWLKEACEKGDILFTPDSIDIRTLEGHMKANHDDWIIRGVKGEIYPCKPDIFAATYEKVQDRPSPASKLPTNERKTSP